MSNFRQALEVYNLTDLGQIGDIFTWSNRHESFSFTKERLDRAVANQDWSMVYKDMKVETLVACSSDHKPLLASCNKLGAVAMRKGRMFRYDACWDLEETYSAKVKQ